MSVFNFKASRTYLLAYVDDLPKKGRGEITRIAEKLGVSTSLVSQVLAGEKSFTPEQANDLVQHLGLTGLEADYLFYLINYERAGTPGLQKLWKTKLEEVRAKALQVINRVSTSRVLNDQERSIYYSSALYSAIRLFTSVGKEGKSLAEVAERFEIARAKASEILNFLADVGLCERLGDRYVMGTQSTHTEQGSPHMLRHHSNWRVRAIQRAENASEEELMYTVQVSLSREDFSQLRESMVRFIKEFLKTVHASPAEEIANFNLDFFWIE